MTLWNAGARGGLAMLDSWLCKLTNTLGWGNCKETGSQLNEKEMRYPEDLERLGQGWKNFSFSGHRYGEATNTILAKIGFGGDGSEMKAASVMLTSRQLYQRSKLKKLFPSHHCKVKRWIFVKCSCVAVWGSPTSGWAANRTPRRMTRR